MTSPAKITANQRNACRSTGPKTVAGQARSSKNAIRHGLLSQDALLPDEDAAEFGFFCDALTRQLDPQDRLEEVLVARIVVCAWRLGRVHRLEASMFAQRMAEIRASRARDEARTLERSPLDGMFDRTEVADNDRYESSLARARSAEADRDAEALGAAFITAADTGDAFSKLSRYETTIERAMFRAMHALERRQAARGGAYGPSASGVGGRYQLESAIAEREAP